MSFKPDRSKQAQEVIFPRKTSIHSHPVLTFDNSPGTKTTHHKHLGLILDEKLNFKDHLKKKMSKAYKGIVALRKLQNIIPRNYLLTIYKSFIRPYLVILFTTNLITEASVRKLNLFNTKQHQQ